MKAVKRKPVTIAWALMDGDDLARIYCSDHRWNIYDCRDAARINRRVYGISARIARVRIVEVNGKK